MSPLKCTYVHFFFEELNFLKDFAAKIWSNYFKVLT